MKKCLIIIFLIFISSGVLFSANFWDFETDPWLDGWTSVKKDQGHIWPYTWDWKPYDLRLRRAPDPGSRSMWISSYDAGSGYVLRDTLISPAIPDTLNSDSLYYMVWLKWGVGYRYRNGRDADTASVLIRTCNGGTWSNWQQIQFYFGSDFYGQYDSFDISSFVKTIDSLQIGFAYRGGNASGYDYYLAIDNVSLITEMTYPGGPALPPTGSDSVLTNNNYTYTSDAATGTVEYQFDWGDGTTSTWTVNTFADKNWSDVGTYFVRSRARHALFPQDSISDWSDSLVVKVLNYNTVYYWGFEENDGGFPIYYLRDWEWGVPASGPSNARSGAKLWATDLYANYNLNYSWLRTPEMFLSAADSAMLYFWMWYDSDLNVDGLNLYVGSSDNFSGSFWNAGSNRYWDEIPGSYVNPVYTGNFYNTWTTDNQDGWTGNGRSWVLYKVNISEYKDHDSLQVLLRLADNNGTAGNLSGFYVDDIRVDTFMRITGPTIAPTGTDSGYINTSYMYLSEALGSCHFQFDWGDGTLSPWTNDPNQYHTWSEVGTYYVRSRIRDKGDTTLISFWSPPLIAKMVSTQTVYYWGFEEDNGGFDNRGSGDWEWGIPQNGPSCARTGEKVWATDLDGIYNSNASWCLSNNINVSYADSAVMYFWMWYESDWNVDGVALIIGSDSLSGYPGTWAYDGTYWDTIPSNLINPVYTGTFYFSWESCTQAGWTGSSALWTLYSLNITPYMTFEDLNVLWRLADNSGTGGNLSGFYIDDIRVDTFMFPIHGPITAPLGPTWGVVDTTYFFVTDTATSGFGALEYQFGWGDGSYSVWDTLRMSDHAWNPESLYEVRARARVQSDTTLIGPWSPPHYIEIGNTGYFSDPWTFEPGLQGWSSSAVWQRQAANLNGATWELNNAENWSLWATGTGQVYVHDTTFSTSISVDSDDKYLIWSSCFRNSTTVKGDTAIVIFKMYIEAMWREWVIAEMITERAYPNWYYEDIPSLEIADSFQMAVVYIHTDGTTGDRFFGIDNIRLTNRPYITEVGWNFEQSTQWDWIHTNGNNWPNGWEIASSGLISSLSLPDDGSRSMWIGNTAAHTIPLIDTVISPADWNPIDVKYFKYGVSFNNQYDSFVIILSGMTDTTWSNWHQIKTYERGTTPSYKGFDSVDISAYSAYSRVAFGFIYYSSINNGAAVIDNITLSSAEGKDALVAPPGPGDQNVFAPAGTYSVEALIINAGTNSADLTVKAVVLDITTGSMIMNEETNVTNMPYLDSLNLNFGSINIEMGHRYKKTISIYYPGDNVTTNDTVETVIRCQVPQWTRLADMPVALSGACSWLDEEGKIHVYGDTLHLSYDPGNNSWSYENPLPYELINGNCAKANDDVFIVGEFKEKEDIMLVYNTRTDNYSTVDIPDGIDNPTVVSFVGYGNDYVYLIPGDDVERPLCYMYDDISKTFINASPLPGGFSGGISVSTNDYLLLSGGDKIGSNFYTGEVNPASPTIINWTTDYYSPVGKLSDVSGAGSDNYLIIVGGEKNNLLISEALLYEEKNGWYTLPDFPIEIADAVVIADLEKASGDSGEIANFYVIGGRGNSGDLTTVYNLSLNLMKPMGEMQEEISTSPFAFSITLSSSNVFDDGVSIRLTLPSNSDVQFSIYDLTGRRVRSIRENLPVGIHTLRWDGNDDNGRDVSTGSYFYMIDTKFGSDRGKLIRVQ